mmetsp:Transcript_71161/g.224792  ORF Transcript_71161/g.224792 Transcript_71161/m.224792 type:complete len:248 (+) Transcript_71161:585-1328(+)
MRSPAGRGPVEGSEAQEEPGLLRPDKELRPRWVLPQGLHVADDDEAAPRAGDHHVQPAPVGQKANASRPVAPHRAENDQLFFAALKGVDGRNLQVPHPLLVFPASAELCHQGLPQMLTEGTYLRCVRRDDSHIRQVELPGSQYLRKDLRDPGDLDPVRARISLALLGPLGVDESYSCIRMRPRKAKRWGAVSRRNAILESSVVELPGAKLGDHGVHAELRVQEEGLQPLGNESAEQRQRQTTPLCLE